LHGTIEVYQKLVQACINAGKIEKAFEYAERSRSKRLVDLMASNDLYQSGEIPPEVEKLLQQYEELQQKIDRERDCLKSNDNRGETRAVFQAYNEAIASLEAEKHQVWEQLRRLDPVLAGEIQVSAPDFSAIQKLGKKN
jgi:chaperonin cofactor prefoldin